MCARDDKFWPDMLRFFLVMSPIVAFVVASITLAIIHRDDPDPTDEHRRMQADDRVIACAMRIHTLEQEVDMLRLRIEELEERNNNEQ